MTFIFAGEGDLASYGYSLLDFRFGGLFLISVGPELAWRVSGFVVALALGMHVAAGVEVVQVSGE